MERTTMSNSSSLTPSSYVEYLMTTFLVSGISLLLRHSPDKSTPVALPHAGKSARNPCRRNECRYGILQIDLVVMILG